MKVVSKYCDTCGIKINDSDLKRSIAIEHESKFYCKDCKQEALKALEASKKSEGKSDHKKKKKENPIKMILFG